MTLLDGADGRTLWTVSGIRPGAGLGRDLAPAGDWNGDGHADLAALDDRHVLVLDGVRGQRLDQGQPAGEGLELVDVEAVGDLDGDGRTDFRLRLRNEHRRPSWVVVGSQAWQELDVAEGWEVSWTASGAFGGPCTAADLDGDGHDDLLVGRTNPLTGERRLSSFSTAGMKDLRSLDPHEPAWNEAGRAAVGWLRAGDPFVVLLAVTVPAPRLWNPGALAVVPAR